MALYELRDIQTDEIINIIEWDGVTEISLGDIYYVTPASEPSTWGGSFPADQNYINIYGGEFYGTFHGLHDGNSTGTSAFAVSSSYALTASYALETGDPNLDNVDHITFDTTPTATPTEGTFVWNDGDGTLDLGLKGGNVTLAVGQQQYAMVYNEETESLSKGDVVYLSGAQGQRISVRKAYASTEEQSKNTIGLVAETILAGEEGLVLLSGVLKKIDTTAYDQGDTLFLSTTPGEFTDTRPTAPNHTVIIGFVERLGGSTQGSIFVKVDNGYEIDELHNVSITTVQNGDLLIRDGDVWVNKKILSGSYRLSGSLDVSGSITASLSGSLSGSVIGFFSGSSTGSFTGSFYGIFDGIKAGSAGISSVQQNVGGDYIYNITFLNSYTTNNYSVIVNGTTDLRIWTIENKTISGFRINSNDNAPTTGDVLWIAIPHNS
jgi:hypothetical protein